MSELCDVETVRGKVRSDALGVTLMHEHLFVDWSRAWPESARRGRADLRESPVTIDLLGDLRMDPYAAVDNQRLDSEELAAKELEYFRSAGGVTIVDPTGKWPGRKPTSQRALAENLGINIVACTGYYLEPSHPEEVRRSSVQELADSMAAEVLEGIGDTGIRAGLIGEIGISLYFTAQEEKILRAAARAQRATHVPLMVHMPSAGKFGDRILDIIEEEGGSIAGTILCHLNWEVDDLYYQIRLLERGCFTEYDMLGMTFYYPEDHGQAPCDRENLKAITALLRLGFEQRILLASDVFLKNMLRAYGGNGYDYVLKHFVPRLEDAGVRAEVVKTLLVGNPRRVFEAAREG